MPLHPGWIVDEGSNHFRPSTPTNLHYDCHIVEITLPSTLTTTKQLLPILT